MEKRHTCTPEKKPSIVTLTVRGMFDILLTDI